MGIIIIVQWNLSNPDMVVLFTEVSSVWSFMNTVEPLLKETPSKGNLSITRWCSWNTDLPFTTLLLAVEASALFVQQHVKGAIIVDHVTRLMGENGCCTG